MSRRTAVAMLSAALAAPASAQTNNYVWAGIDQGGGLSYWNKFTNAEAWYLNGGALGTGYPGDSYAGHSGDTDTATFVAKAAAAINPIVNPDPSEGNRAFYSFASLSVDNSAVASGWTFGLDATDTPTSLNLQSTGTALTITGTGNTVTFNNGFGVGASGQTWSVGGNTAFNDTVALGGNDLNLSLGGATATFGKATTTSGGKLSVAGTGTMAGSTNINLTVAGTVNPGASDDAPGTLAFNTAGSGSTALSGAYEFDLTAAGTGGVAFNSGASNGTHDLLTALGPLSAAGLKVNIESVGDTDFDNTLTYSWLIASVNGGSLTGTPTLNTITGTDFSSVAGGEFSVNVFNNGVYLNFTPAPEPGAILGAAAMVIGVMSRRRRTTGEAP